MMPRVSRLNSEFPARSIVVHHADTEAADDVLPRLVSLLSRGMARLLAGDGDEAENDENRQETVDFSGHLSVTTDGQRENAAEDEQAW